ncbi:MAG TPA: 16S rRNA (guanine(527)-N(7))-methyltransferase RsmG [Candidatus Mediterraneibacter cottocaccae]|nr:16S rRNA (guanine(527)-N(7))-methyltransferase RsmG [Candidatus Mediterraneibacter cottocaccae]
MDNVKKSIYNEKNWHGIQLTEKQCSQFDRYYELLNEWNKVMNLTAITDYDEVVLKHFIDSLSLVRVLDLSSVHSLIDVGTGAGFPGIPIKIAFPHINVTLLDSLNKRVKFLDTVISELKLDDISAVHGRAEDLAKKAEYREKSDCCVSRAVANLATLSEYCLPFVRCGGNFVSYKSGSSDEEIREAEKAVKILGGKIEKIDKFVLPGSDMGRALVKISKKVSTPKKYPRKAGVPGKEPLK